MMPKQTTWLSSGWRQPVPVGHPGQASISGFGWWLARFSDWVWLRNVPKLWRSFSHGRTI